MESSLATGDDLNPFSFQEKPHYGRRKTCQNAYFSVPQTDTGGRVEYTQVIGLTTVKELGNRNVRNFGIRTAQPIHALEKPNEVFSRSGMGWAAANELKRLFTKNTALC